MTQDDSCGNRTPKTVEGSIPCGSIRRTTEKPDNEGRSIPYGSTKPIAPQPTQPSPNQKQVLKDGK